MDPNAFARLKGARDLPPQNLAILRELYELREQLARTLDRPPFKILAEETLVRLAQTPPDDLATLALDSGMHAERDRTVGRGDRWPPWPAVERCRRTRCRCSSARRG